MLTVVRAECRYAELVMLSGIMPLVICAECHYAWGYYAECGDAGGHLLTVV
jgi:hypothetical protein